MTVSPLTRSCLPTTEAAVHSSVSLAVNGGRRRISILQPVIHVHRLTHLLERHDPLFARAADTLLQDLVDVRRITGIADATFTNGCEVLVDRIGEQRLQLAAATVADALRDRFGRLARADCDETQQVRDFR